MNEPVVLDARIVEGMIRTDERIIAEVKRLRRRLKAAQRAARSYREAYHAALDLLVIERVTADQLWRRTLEQRDAIAELRAAPAPRRTDTDG